MWTILQLTLKNRRRDVTAMIIIALRGQEQMSIKIVIKVVGISRGFIVSTRRRQPTLSFIAMESRNNYGPSGNDRKDGG